nr:unnamed protein product [Callosobruchus analis]
MNAILEHR